MKIAEEKYALYHGYNNYKDNCTKVGGDPIKFGMREKPKSATSQDYASCSLMNKLREFAEWLQTQQEYTLYKNNDGFYGYRPDNDSKTIVLLIPSYESSVGCTGIVVDEGETLEGGCEDDRHLKDNFQHGNVGNAKAIYVV